LARFALGLALFVFLAANHPAAAENASLEEAKAEMVLGSADAPVTMIEY